MLAILAHPLVFNLLVLLASLFVLYKAADLLVFGISDYAKRLGLSDAIIGLVVVAMAASAPEIISALTGFLSGETGVGYGTILGTNMIHAAFALGLLALMCGKLTIEKSIFTRERLFLWIALMLPFVLAVLGRELSRIDGAILVLAFIIYLVNLWRAEGTLGKLKKNVRLQNIWKDAFIFLGCLAALMLSGRWLVFSAVNLAYYFSIPAYFVALTVIGIATTLPDMAVEFRAEKRKHASLGMGDLLGSLAIELLLFFGIVALISPIEIDLYEAGNALFFLAASITLLIFWLKKKTLSWKHGLVFLGLYAVFLAVEIWRIAG
ncbi:MAG TPA: sodium:calcium antiporter [Candidatus Nanoarchaeia archaeon]|nr:sodium:calcium antiporter [Candidatus Nanoarchaeia archaeon]